MACGKHIDTGNFGAETALEDLKDFVFEGPKEHRELRPDHLLHPG